MEMALLQLIQSWHNPILDKIMVIVFMTLWVQRVKYGSYWD